MPPEDAETARIASTHLGTWNHRYEVALADGARVESVLYRGDTLCISTQVGCAVGCPFCASGAFGLDRA
ncbi:MAG: rRNA methyltransferase, partial [Polyangiaceae bacterium]|nr:rRNA methyltransferase [Polyangiaceae bacterium]